MIPIYLHGGPTLTARTEGGAAEPPGRTAVGRIVVGEPEASQHDYAVCALRLFLPPGLPSYTSTLSAYCGASS
jgi:hypothetical protein